MARALLAAIVLRVAWTAGCLLFLAPVFSLAQGTAEGKVPSPAAAEGSFLVFPFENTGAGPRLDWLSEGLEELTIQRLAAAGQQVFTHEARLAELERYGLPASAKFTRATMLHIAEDLDADYAVFGSYAYDGRILAVQARLLRISPAALLPSARETGLLDTLMDLHTRVVWRLLMSSNSKFPVALSEFSRAQRPLRLDAFEHYIRGLRPAEEETRVKELREAVRLEPEWPDPAFALGQLSLAKRDCPTAVTWFARVPRTHDRFIEAMFSIGVCRLWTNEAGRAEAAFSELQAALRGASSDAGDVPEVLNNLAMARARLGKIPLAREDLRRAADLDPDENDYPFNLGLVALRANDPDGAVSELREALQREPDDNEARALLIFALELAGKNSEANAERAAASAAANAGPLPVIRAESLPQLGRIATELDATTLPQEIQFAGRHADGAGATSSAAAAPDHVKRGRQELSTGRLADAEREFRAALALDARDAAAHRGLAEILRRQGKIVDAAAELRASIEARDSAGARTALAKLYLDQKKTDLARRELERALQLAPNYAEAKQLLQRLSPSKPGDATP